MIRRMLWLGVGWMAGAGTTWWVGRRVRRTVRRYAPPQVRDRLALSARRAGSTVGGAVREGRRAMRERESDVRAALDGRARRA